ncbi:MAG: hypothetical protein ABW055_03705 [Pararhizobium sp.]
MNTLWRDDAESLCPPGERGIHRQFMRLLLPLWPWIAAKAATVRHAAFKRMPARIIGAGRQEQERDLSQEETP